jgi:DNA processing protein
MLTAHAERGIGVVCPGDPDWPPQLDDLGRVRPYALWVRGNQQALRTASVAIIGARAATCYSTHVATEIASALAARGWAIISGAAYGVDAAAHRSPSRRARRRGPLTIAVLACGPDYAYPRDHRGLLDAIVAQGAVVSESPPGTPPSRARFLLRNRIIAALAGGTVVVEAAPCGGSMAAARYVSDLGRPLMAVPGPVTSAASAGCHELIHDRQATYVASAAEICACLEAVADC